MIPFARRVVGVDGRARFAVRFEAMRRDRRELKNARVGSGEVYHLQRGGA